MKRDLPNLKCEPACFAAGTLVHTKEGLKPIEQIQVGDWVLSKHESGEGEQAYKRVTQTFKHEDREVMLVTIGGKQEDGEDRTNYFIVTPEHPVWVQGKGWKPASKLKWTVPFWHVEWLIPDTPRIVNDPLPLVVTFHENVAWFPGTAGRSALNYRGGLININTLEFIKSLEFVSSDAPIDINSAYKTSRIKPEHLFRTTVYNIEVEDFHTYYVGKAGMWASAYGSKATQAQLEKAEVSTAKVKPKPGVAPFTIKKMDAALRVALKGDSILGNPNSLRDRYKLAYSSGGYSSTSKRYEYHFSELFEGRSGIEMIMKVERPYSRLLLTAFTRLPLECVPQPASPSEENKYFHYHLLGTNARGNVYYESMETHYRLVIFESLQTHHQRLHWRNTGERISADELPWYNLQDLNDIKPALEDLIALALAMGEKCQSLKGIAWLYNSNDPEAARLFTGNIANQDFLIDPDARIQARSLYLAWRFQDPRFENFCRDYISRWDKPRKREVIETHPYYALPRYAELLRNTPPPTEDEDNESP